MPEDFIARPTDVLISYVARSKPLDKESVYVGRLAMALEIITVMKLLEDHQLIAEHEEMVSCLQTLLNDQDLASAHEWYGVLSEWRRLKLDHVGGESEPASDDAGPSADA